MRVDLVCVAEEAVAEEVVAALVDSIASVKVVPPIEKPLGGGAAGRGRRSLEDPNPVAR